MIQSQSLGGPPADSGGNAKGGDGDTNRRPSAGHPSSRHEPPDSRVHRHDSRDLGPSPALKDWRRPSRGPEVSRRDDRGFKDRWKDRKRWEKPRLRDLMPHTHRDNSREAPRTPLPEHDRGHGLKSYKDVTQNDPVEPPRMNGSHTLVSDYNRPKTTYEDDRRGHRKKSLLGAFSRPDQKRPSEPPRGPKKFSKPPGSKFRDLMMGTAKAPKSADSQDSVGEHAEVEHSVKPEEQKANDQKHEDSKEHEEHKEEARSHKPEKLNHVPEESEKSETVASVKPDEELKEHNQEEQMDEPKEVKSVLVEDQMEDDHAEEINGVGHADEPSHPQSPESPKVKANGHSAEEVHSKADDAVTDVVMEDVKPGAQEEPDNGAVPFEESSADPVENDPPINGLLKGEINGTGEPKDAKVAIESPVQKEEDFMDVEPAKDESQEPETEPVDREPPKAIAPLPQELLFHTKLVKEFAAVSEAVSPGTVQTKLWSIPPVSTSVVSIISQNEQKANAELEERIETSKTLKKAWLKQAALLDEMSSMENPETETKPRSSSQENVKPQPTATSNHSRKKSRDEDSSGNSTNRRNRDRHSRAHGDVARSEAEFLEILANLEAQTARDPLVRARLTSARIPNQCQSGSTDRFCSTNALIKDHSILLKRLEVDAINDFTEEQHLKFIEAYVKWPKEFGKIGEAVGRSFNDCVMHYYQTKKATDYKRILYQKNKKKRGRKPKKRNEDDPKSFVSPDPAASDLPTFEGKPHDLAEDDDELASSSAGTPVVLSQAENVPVIPAEPSESIASIEDMTIDEIGVQRPARLKRPPPPPSAMEDASSSIPDMSRMPVKGKFLEPAQPVQEANVVVPTTAPPAHIPPPVLPVQQQMETLATAALNEGPKWMTAFDVKSFEQLFRIFGLNFAEISRHLEVPVESIQQFLNYNYAYYEGLLRSMQPYTMANGHTVPQVSPAFYAKANGISVSQSQVSSQKPQEIQKPEAVPTIRSAPQPTLDGSYIHQQQKLASSQVPHPVQPLERNETPREEESVEPSIPNISQAAVQPIPSPPNDTIKPKAKIATAELQIWPEFSKPAPTIPPILPRTLKGSVLQNFYLNEYSFTGFNESNERN